VSGAFNQNISWVPQFCGDFRNIGSSGFYPAVSQLLERFLRHEQAHLQELEL
jgi:TorA maturation chaperone TorD